MAKKAQPERVVATNPKAYHDYHIEETFEAGIVLTGSETKSVRAGRISLREGYVLPREGELWLMNVHIAPYEPASRDNPDPRRPRKLLLHRHEINRLIGKAQEKGYTIVPLKVYWNARGFAKVEIALAKGKKQYEKRRAIAEREARREIERALREKG